MKPLARPRVGVFGGTFDPIHIGHLIVAEEARIQLSLREVVFMVAGQPWLKSGQRITDPRHRMAMVELAVESNPYFTASDAEIVRPGPTYTVETLVEMRAQLGADTGIYVILGLDSLKELARWRQPERILVMATVVGVTRPGTQAFDPASLNAISHNSSESVVLLEGPGIDVSGEEVRRRLRHGVSVKYQLPESVERYVYEHGLYGTGKIREGRE